ncbi:MAG: hypothetical protein U5L06_07305 [Rhodovibrio sp.]|nr:hypothetical protein [Rhodovibrio sp.]
MGARQHGLGQVGVERRDLAVEGLRQDALEAQPQVGVVPVAGHEHQAGDEPLERVLAGEQRDPLALLQVQDAHRDAVEVVLADLEQLVARVVLQDVQQRLAVVAVRAEAALLQHPVDLAAQQRDLARRARIGGGGEQPGDQLLAGDVAVIVERLDRERVQMDRPVHGRPAVRLGDPQQVGLVQERLHLARQLAQIAQAVEQAVFGVGQDAQPAVVVDLGDGARARSLEAVLAVAEEGEVVVGDPFQERDALVQLAGVERRRTGLQLLDHRPGLTLHRPPVAHRRAHVGEHPGQVLLQLAQAAGRLLADLDVHQRFARRLGVRPGHGAGLGRGVPALGLRGLAPPLGLVARLALGRRGLLVARVRVRVGGVDVQQPALIVARDPQDRVDHQVHLGVQVGQALGHAVDQEGHVVVHDLHDRVRRAVAVFLDLRVIGADLGGARLPGGGEVQHRHRLAVQVVGVVAQQVVGRHVGVELAGEPLGHARAVGIEAALHPLDDAVDQIGFQLLCARGHGV